MPFTRHVSAVAGGFKGLGDGDAFLVEEALVLWNAVVARHVADARLVRIKAGEERGAGGTATGGIVELGEAEAVGGEGVEIGRVDLTSVATEV